MRPSKTKRNWTAILSVTGALLSSNLWADIPPNSVREQEIPLDVPANNTPPVIGDMPTPGPSGVTTPPVQTVLQSIVVQHGKVVQEIQTIDQTSTLTTAQKQAAILQKHRELKALQTQMTREAYLLKGENYKIYKANKQDLKMRAKLDELDRNLREIEAISAQIGEHWANTDAVIIEQPGKPSFAKNVQLPSTTVIGKDGKSKVLQQPGQTGTETVQGKRGTGRGTMTPAQLSAAYSKIMQKNGKIKALEAQLERRNRRFRKTTGHDHPALVVDGKTGKVLKGRNPTQQPSQLPAGEVPPASSTNPIQVTPNTGQLPPAGPRDPGMENNPKCWTVTPDPIAELIPNVIFETGKDDISEEQAEQFMSQLRLLQEKMKANGHEKIGKIEAISSASFIPRRAAGGNEALAASRGNAINNNFKSGLMQEEALNALMAPNYEQGLAQGIEHEQGPAWDPQDSKNLKGVKPTEEEIQAKAEELMGDPNAPFSKTSLDTAIAEVTKCCSKDKFSLKYRPHQYAKIRIYGSVFKPDNPECVNSATHNPAVSTHTTTEVETTPAVAGTTTPATTTPANPATSVGSIDSSVPAAVPSSAPAAGPGPVVLPLE